MSRYSKYKVYSDEWLALTPHQWVLHLIEISKSPMPEFSMMTHEDIIKILDDNFAKLFPDGPPACPYNRFDGWR